jgi:hypothetical protein
METGDYDFLLNDGDGFVIQPNMTIDPPFASQRSRARTKTCRIIVRECEQYLQHII